MKTNELVTAKVMEVARQLEKKPIIAASRIIETAINEGEIIVPENYSPQNAIKSAYLIMMVNKDYQGKTLLDVCTLESTVNALTRMVVEGLDPGMKQCDLIEYGGAMVMQRSRFGDKLLAKRFNPRILDFYESCVYEGEIFRFGFSAGKNVVFEHDKTLEFPGYEFLQGAYCGAIDINGQDMGCDFMNMDRIRKSWEMSKTYKKGYKDKQGNLKETVHDKFTDEMAIRTVTRHFCKKYINNGIDTEMGQAMKKAHMNAIKSRVNGAIEVSQHQSLPKATITEEIESYVEEVESMPEVADNNWTQDEQELQEQDVTE